MSDKKVLITGAAGFLGSHLCDRFVKEGFMVVGMDNLITGSMKNIEHLMSIREFQFYHCDVSKFVHVPGKLDYILHFASPASPIDYLKMPIGIKDPDDTGFNLMIAVVGHGHSFLKSFGLIINPSRSYRIYVAPIIFSLWMYQWISINFRSGSNQNSGFFIYGQS